VNLIKAKKYKCVVCGKNGIAHTHNRKFCSAKCKNTIKTEKRYERGEHDWYRYFRHLLSKKNNSTLTAEQLIGKIAEQDYKCALSGVELTCFHRRGEIILTNASIDRINAGKEYNYDNIQIVCRAVNSFRGNMEIKEFINWCNRVADYALQE
jgi:predicted nucleic acid-binding Zn ribbon protein